MNTFKEKIKKYVPTRRKIIQLYSALLFNVNFKGFISGNIYKGDTKKVCIPGLNCYSCPGAIGACPLGSLQGSFSAGKSTVYYVFGIIALYGLIFGRMICGWLCPFGLIQELLYKVKTPKLKKSPVTRLLSYFKYVVLVFFVLIVPIMYAFRDTPLPTFCKYICPAGTLEGGIGLLSNKVNESYFSMLGPLFTWKFVLMVSIIVCCVFIFRMFCRFICPLGAIYGFFNRFSFFGVKVDHSKCTDCNLCVSHCKMDIKQVGDHECINCGECIKACPVKAISWKGSGIFVSPSDNSTEESKKTEKTRLITRCISTVVLIIILITVVCFYWNESSTPVNPPSNTPSDDIPEDSSSQGGFSEAEPQLKEGNELGNLCYGYDLTVVDKNGPTSETINPVKTGKITVINFWGTWCTPCVNELPYFDQIASEYKDDVAVIAIHTNMASETEPAYIEGHYPDSEMIFASDSEGEGYYASLGGRDAYPYTVIIDENGIIIKISLAPLEYEDLKEVIEEHLSK